MGQVLLDPGGERLIFGSGVIRPWYSWFSSPLGWGHGHPHYSGTPSVYGLVLPVNICGPFPTRAGIDQIHSKGVLRVCGKDVPMCPPHQPRRPSRLPPPQPLPGVCTLHVSEAPAPCQQCTPSGPLVEARLGDDAVKIKGRSRAILSLRVRPHLPAGTLVLLQPAVSSLLGDNSILQEIRPDGIWGSCPWVSPMNRSKWALDCQYAEWYFS